MASSISMRQFRPISPCEDDRRKALGMNRVVCWLKWTLKAVGLRWLPGVRVPQRVFFTIGIRPGKPASANKPKPADFVQRERGY